MSDLTASYDLILLQFMSIFIHFYWPFMSEVLYSHQTFTDCFFLINLVFQYACYESLSDLNAFFGVFSNIITYLRHFIFIKLEQIVYA